MHLFVEPIYVYGRGLRSRGGSIRRIDLGHSAALLAFEGSILDGNGSATRLGIGFVGGYATVSARNATEKIISRYVL